jgi:cyclopropane fatty-acyl-phospholipid synthase-like methyltransferase
MPADPNIIKRRGESVLLACWSGPDYAEAGSLQRTMVHEVISQLAFSEDERVLDVGCGDGLLTRHGADGIRPVVRGG